MKTADFSASPVFDKLKQFEARIHSDEASEKVDLENLDFYRSAASYIRSQLDKSITVLINAAELNDIHSLIDNSLREFNGFLGNGNVGHLNNIETYLYPALKAIRNLPVPNVNDDFSYSALINDLKTLSTQKIAEVNKSIESVEEDIEAVETELAKKETDIQNISKAIADKQTQIETLNQSFQTNFDLIKSTEATKFEELRERLKKTLEEQAKRIEDDTKSLVDRLNHKEDEAKKLVNVIGNIGATGNYQRIADAHRLTANIWRWVAVGFMTILSGILIVTIWKIGGDKYDWQMALVRILSALVLTYPATYAAQESAKHRKLENDNRKAELELASINPFIEILDDERKQLIKEKLVEKYFGNNHTPEATKDKDNQGVPFKVLDKAVEIVKELKK